MKFTGKWDKYLIAGLLLISLAGLAFSRFQASRNPAVYAVISVDEENVQTLDLRQDTQITIEDGQGRRNVLVVQDGQIYCSEASCPDKLCVRQGHKSRAGEVIVCLPNRMAVTLQVQ